MFIKPKKKGWISGPAAFYKAAGGGGGGGGVVFDAISNATPVSSTNSISWTHTPAGTPSAVAVLIGGFDNSGFPTLVTYGGVTMTAGGTLFGATGTAAVVIFGLANPPAGAQTVSATGASASFMAGAAITVTGSDLTTCFRNTSGNTGTGASSTTTVVSVANDLIIDCVAGFQASGAASGQGGGQTSRYTDFWNGNLSFGVSTSPGAASVTDTWATVNSGGTNAWAASNASFKHA